MTEEKIKQTDVPDLMRIASSTNVFKPSELEVLADDLVDVIDCDDKEYMIVGERINGRLEAFAHVAREAITDFAWQIEWLAVDKSCCGKGIGKRLIKRVEEHVLGFHPYAVISAETSSRTEYIPARNLYLMAGYTESGRVSNYYAQDDDKVIYTKQISRSFKGILPEMDEIIPEQHKITA